MKSEHRAGPPPPPPMLTYPPRWLIRLSQIILVMPGVFELIFGVGLITETERQSGTTRWLSENGLPPELIGGAMVVGGALFILYQLFWRNHRERDAILSGILQSPLSFRILIAMMYGITFGTLTLYGLGVTWGLYILLLTVYIFAWGFDNYVHAVRA